MYHCENGVCYLTSYEPCKNYIVCKNKLSENEKGEICNDCYHIFGEWRERWIIFSKCKLYRVNSNFNKRNTNSKKRNKRN